MDIARKFPDADADICPSKPSSDYSLLPSRKGIEHIRVSPANICPSISQKPCNIRILLRLFASSCLNICEVKTVPPCGEKIFDGFLRGGAKESVDFLRLDAIKDAKIYRRRAYLFDSLAARHNRQVRTRL